MRKLIRHKIGYDLVICLMVIFTLWWLYLHLIIPVKDIQHQFFAAIYGSMALIGGLIGIYISKKWGGLNSMVGRALIMFSLGLFAQEFGQLTYSYYIFFLHIDVPYPSIGDLGYFGSILFYLYGLVLIARVSGVRLTLKSVEKNFYGLLAPIIILCISYWFFLSGYEFDWAQPLTVFLDFGYPLGQATYLSFAVLILLLSQGILGGIMKNNIRFIIVALFIQYIADYMFLYQASNGGWYAGGVNDFIYLLSYFMMTLSLLQFNSTYRKFANTNIKRDS